MLQDNNEINFPEHQEQELQLNVLFQQIVSLCPAQ